jgi:integrase
VFGIKDNVKNSFAGACKEAGVLGFRFHDCRHTAITRMVAAGVAPMELMKISGHTQITTFARYVNPTEQAVKRAAEALALFNSQATEEHLQHQS